MPHHERSRAARPARGERPEVSLLRQLRAAQPDLANAVDLQIALLQLQYRVQTRLSMPWFEIDEDRLKTQQREGRPFLRFKDIPLDWTDVRLVFRRTADLLLRHETLEQSVHERMQTLARSGHALEPLIIRWYEAKAAPERADQTPGPPADVANLDPETLDQVVTLTLHPFLEPCATVLQQRADFSAWFEPYCPVCGGAPEFAVITPAADRLLLCSRCGGRWAFDPLACPFCRNANRSLITSFASRDGQYRLYACDVCRRYLKAYDGRRAARPVMLALDTIATLPLDAAALQRGYRA